MKTNTNLPKNHCCANFTWVKKNTFDSPNDAQEAVTRENVSRKSAANNTIAGEKIEYADAYQVIINVLMSIVVGSCQIKLYARCSLSLQVNIVLASVPRVCNYFIMRTAIRSRSFDMRTHMEITYLNSVGDCRMKRNYEFMKSKFDERVEKLNASLLAFRHKNMAEPPKVKLICYISCTSA